MKLHGLVRINNVMVIVGAGIITVPTDNISFTYKTVSGDFIVEWHVVFGHCFGHLLLLWFIVVATILFCSIYGVLRELYELQSKEIMGINLKIPVFWPGLALSMNSTTS